MEKVIVAKCDSYDVEKLKNILSDGFKELDIKLHGRKILLKPNLLSAKSPEKAVTTHPEFVRAVAQLLRDSSCNIHIGDSPGYESTEKVLLKSGLMEVVKSSGLIVSPFSRKIKKRVQGISPYREFTLAEEPDDFDVIINLPKLKTHMMMGLTLGVKNTFGFIHAMDKAKWHLKAGTDKTIFASMLIDIHSIVKPDLTVLDGVVGMDKDGPSGGRVRNMGLVALSKNAFALDYHIEKLAQMPFPLPISLQAKQQGMLPEFEVIALGSPVHPIDDFQLPGTMAADWSLPRFAKNLLKNFFIAKPKIRTLVCKRCRVCIGACPAAAISIREKALSIDYSKCIRCYCCHEMCPEGAITV
jgi:uncharacterized protein (DUF362 family)/NAD-dependent dihydropyrimidine dehydrogenase PreA subunit